MTKAELRAVIQDWWEYNQTMAEVPQAKYFLDQAHQKSKGDNRFEIIKSKDVVEGVAITLKSGENEISGILRSDTGVWIERGSEGPDYIKQTANPND